jgi:hypothetical protein
MDDYTTLLWTPLCEEVAKLKVRLRREPERIAAVVNAPAASTETEATFEPPASAPAEPAFAAGTPSGVTPRATPENAAAEMPFDPALLTPISDSARRGTRTTMAVNR